ncbi:uncharacterized protein V6R79_004353 [Siganus canaliculatus]
MVRLTVAEAGLLLLFALALVAGSEARQRRPNTLRRKKREWILPPSKLIENTDYSQRKYIAKIRSDKDEDVKVQYFLTGSGADQEPYNLFQVDHDTGFVRITGMVDREQYPSFSLTGIARYANGSTAESNIPLIVRILDQNDNAPYFTSQSGNVKEGSKAGTFVMQIEGKDDDETGTIHTEIAYSIVSQEPRDMFTIDQKTGKVYVKEPTLDRETNDLYKLVIMGSDMGGAPGGLTGTGTVEIKILDVNDNIPTLEHSEYTGSVNENVDHEIVMRIKALDQDLEHTDNWQTVFIIAKGNENNLFSIETDKETNEGILTLIKPVNYEEVQNLELELLIENVAPLVTGNAVTSNVDIQVAGGGSSSSGGSAGGGGGGGGSAGGGGGGTAGGGGGSSTGGGGGAGGVLKPGTSKRYSIKIAVKNMPEGPKFIPATKKVPVSEDPKDQPKNAVITVFAATDPDTGEPAENVSYAKAFDPDNWLSIDEETAEIKLKKQPDRESPYVVNGTYIAKILVISKDMPSTTATGTIAIEVADSNDHCPVLTTSRTSLCSDKKTVYVTALDEDVSPNAAPFAFRIISDGTRGSWDVEIINDTTAAFHSRESLWPGSYALEVEVLDAQGLSCPASEVFTVDVCTCVETEECSIRAAKLGAGASELSASAIGLLLMALCLLLLIPLLLLFCQCGGVFADKFSDLPIDAKEHLISYHTEGPGEDKEVPLQSVPISQESQKEIEMASAPNFHTLPSRITETHQISYNESVQQFQESSQAYMEVDQAYTYSKGSFNRASGFGAFSGQTDVAQYMTSFYEDIALSDEFLSDYYSQKARCAVLEKDDVTIYDYQGQGSPAGSVGCCSLLDSDNDLQFLNDLGPKFKTLAQICSPPAPAPTPKPSITREVSDTDKAKAVVVEPAVQANFETKHKIKTEQVMSFTDISKSSVSSVSTAPPSVINSNISDSSITSQSTILSHQAQAVVLPPQPVYYTTSPMLQNVQYVLQPQLQNTVLLTSSTNAVSLPGLFVVNGPQSPPPGFIISGAQGPSSGLVIQGTESSIISGSPTSPVSPTLLVPVSPEAAQGSVPVVGWTMSDPNPNLNYVLIKDNGSPGESVARGPGSPPGIVPRGAVLVEKTASPQGLLGSGAQRTAEPPRKNIKTLKKKTVVNKSLGKTMLRQSVEMGSGPVTVRKTGPGLGHVVPAMPGCPPSNEEVIMKNIKSDGDQTHNLHNDTAEEKQDVLTCAPVHLTLHDVDPSEVVTGEIPPTLESEKSSPVDKDTGKLSPEPSVVQTPSEQSDTKDEEPGDATDDLNAMNEASSSQQTDPQEKAEEEAETSRSEKPDDDVPDDGFSGEGMSSVATMSTEDTEEQMYADVDTSAFSQEEDDATDHKGITDSEAHDGAGESVVAEDTVLLKVEKQEEGKPQQHIEAERPEDISFKVGSECQLDQITEDQNGKDVHEGVTSAKHIVSDLEASEFIATDTIQSGDSMETQTTSNANVTEPEEQLSDSAVSEEMSAAAMSAPTATASEFIDSSISDQVRQEIQVEANEGDDTGECHAESDTADAGLSLQTASTVLAPEQEGDGDDPSLIPVSDEIQQALAEGSDVTNISALTESAVDELEVSPDGDSMIDGQEEEEGVSRHSFSPSDDQDEDSERQNVLNSSSQSEDNFISDDNSPNEECDQPAPPVQQNTDFTDDQETDTAGKDASSTGFQVNDASNPRNEEEIEEMVASETTSEDISQDNTEDEAKEEDTDREVLSEELKTSSSDGEADSGSANQSTAGLEAEDKSVSGDSLNDVELSGSSALQNNVSVDTAKDSTREDALGPSPESQVLLVGVGNECDGEMEDTVTATSQQNLSVPGDQEEGACDTEDSHTEVQEVTCEMTTQQVSQAIASSQGDDANPKEQDDNNGVLMEDVNMEGVGVVVTSLEDQSLSRVATGQVSIAMEDNEAVGSISASGQLSEGGTPCIYHNTEVAELSDGEEANLERAEVPFDSTKATKEELQAACGQVSDDSRVMDQNSTDQNSTETETASFIATSEQGKAEVIQEAEASAGQEKPVEVQTSGLRNKFRKSKKDSNKSPKSPKSPSAKCKQQ